MLIEVEKLNYTYASSEKEKVHALMDVSLNIRQGEFVALVGSSGSGKSTFVRHLNGLIKADSGDIRFQGESIYQKKYPISKLRQKVGLVFQYPEHQLFSRSVLADVAFGPRNMGDSKEEAENKAKFEGNVKVEYEDLTVMGKRAEVNIDPQTKKLKDATFFDQPYVIQVKKGKTNEIKANIIKMSLI